MLVTAILTYCTSTGIFPLEANFLAATWEGLLLVHADLQDVGEDTVHLEVHGVRYNLSVLSEQLST